MCGVVREKRFDGRKIKWSSKFGKIQLKLLKKESNGEKNTLRSLSKHSIEILSKGIPNFNFLKNLVFLKIIFSCGWEKIAEVRFLLETTHDNAFLSGYPYKVDNLNLIYHYFYRWNEMQPSHEFFKNCAKLCNIKYTGIQKGYFVPSWLSVLTERRERCG